MMVHRASSQCDRGFGTNGRAVIAKPEVKPQTPYSYSTDSWHTVGRRESGKRDDMFRTKSFALSKPGLPCNLAISMGIEALGGIVKGLSCCPVST
jgi:hypothetical protein